MATQISIVFTPWSPGSKRPPPRVLREKTERPEAVTAGTVKLVGTDEGRIVREATTLLDNREAYNQMSRVHNPYGDGRASARIAGLIHSFLTANS